MNIVQRSTTTRQPNFVTAILEADISPYMLGVLDAERSEMACPEMYFTQLGQLCEYCEGYEAVAGPTLTTVHFLGKRAATEMVTPADMEATIDAVFAALPVDDRQLGLDLFDYEAAAEAYEDDMLDREYHARGLW